MKKRNLCLVIVAITFLGCQIGWAKEKPTAQDWLLKGIELEQKGVHAEAIKMFTEAIDLDPSLAAAYFHRGKSYIEHHKTFASEALRDYDKTIALEPTNAEAYYERGLLNAFVINNENARADMNAAARLGHEGARKWLAPPVEEKAEVAAAPVPAVAEAPQKPAAQEEAKEGPYFPINEYLASKKEPRVHFDLNRSDIKQKDQPLLDEIAVLFKEKLPQARIVVGGHTDSSGSESYNHSLSLQRARAVEAYLKEKHGLAPERFILKGYGKGVPIATNKTRKGQAQNRRVEVMGEGKR